MRPWILADACMVRWPELGWQPAGPQNHGTLPLFFFGTVCFPLDVVPALILIQLPPIIPLRISSWQYSLLELVTAGYQ